MKVALRDIRLRRKMTQAELARKSGVSQPIISQIENGSIASPGIETVWLLAQALRCFIDDLIIPDDDKKVV